LRAISRVQIVALLYGSARRARSMVVDVDGNHAKTVPAAPDPTQTL
jgi:hypothetical protein